MRRGLPACIPEGRSAAGIIEEVVPRTTGSVLAPTLALVPDRISFTESSLRSGLRLAGRGGGALEAFDEIRSLIADGYVYTHEDLRADLAGRGGALETLGRGSLPHRRRLRLHPRVRRPAREPYGQGAGRDTRHGCGSPQVRMDRLRADVGLAHRGRAARREVLARQGRVGVPWSCSSPRERPLPQSDHSTTPPSRRGSTAPTPTWRPSPAATSGTRSC